YHVLTPAPPLVLLFLPTLLPPPRSTLFPYTTLFRSLEILRAGPGRRRRVFLLDRRLGSFRRGSARRLGHRRRRRLEPGRLLELGDRKSTRLNSSHDQISYAVFCLKKKKKIKGSIMWS